MDEPRPPIDEVRIQVVIRKRTWDRLQEEARANRRGPRDQAGLVIDQWADRRKPEKVA
ncbi:MAG TPA: hypothetical protein VKG20_20595 [Methylomirabilota bacterium]|nr:hypothetical protein [Methylomirabilota bacterium]